MMNQTLPKYYDIRTDLELYPEAWCYLIWSKRGPGKTYSTLRYCVEENTQFIFMKRTIEDVNLLCKRIEDEEGNIERTSSEDMNPFSPLNRDLGWEIYPFLISSKGLAAFYKGYVSEEDGKLHPEGKCLGWILAASAVSKFKGFSLDSADIIIFDEFIPKPWERINRKEGDSILDLYLTVSRDRLKRGRKELKLICLANATSLNNPMFNTLQVTDYAAEMDIKNREFTYLEDGTLLHMIQSNFDEDENREKTGIEKRMEGTDFALMAWGGHFGYNDLSCVGTTSLKGYKPVVSIIYKKNHFYVYQKDGFYYMTNSRHQGVRIFDLNRENDQKLFFIEYDLDLREACVDGKMLFETFTMYDLIVNYKQYFKI